MSNYEDEQSEDGELARSPVQDELDFSLSDEDRDNADSLVIKPPQAVVRMSHRDRRGHKKSTKERFKEAARKDKKHLFRERDKPDKSKRDNMSKATDQEEMPKDYYRDKQYYREKESYRDKELYRDKEIRDKVPYREKEMYREKDVREKEFYRERERDNIREKEMYREKEARDKELHREKDVRDKEVYREKDARDKEVYREKDVREKEVYREKEVRDKEVYREKDARDKEVYRDKDPREKEIYREKDGNREREIYREKELYRDRDHYRDRDVYRGENATYREAGRPREMYREKEMYKEKETRDRETYVARDSQARYSDPERKQRKDTSIEARLRALPDQGQSGHNEKENQDRTSGDKELEDLRSRLLSKRITKELQTKEPRSKQEYVDKERPERNSSLDKHQQERRKRLLQAEREMEKRKHESRTELEARREERRRRGKKRSASPEDTSSKKTKPEESPHFEEAVVTLSDTSDVEMKSESPHSDPEEGEHSRSESDDDSSGTDTDSEAESKSEDEPDEKEDNLKLDKEEAETEKPKLQSKSPEKVSNHHDSPSSHESRRSRTKSKSRSRSRSHSFSPPPTTGENGKPTVEEEQPKEDEEEVKRREEEINALPPYFPALQGCRSVEEFQCLNRIEEGTYGVVYRARDKTTEEIVALKRLKMEKEKEGFPITSLREINTLLKGQHPNIVTVREIVVGSNMDKIFIVMDYVEHDLKSLMETMRSKKQVFLPGEVKCLMTQLLRAVHHLHDNWILHRDLKTSNLLLSHKGVLKVGDFGLAREYGSPLRQYTPIVVTLWYRAPELLLCCKEYSTPIDMWSVGCIFAEFITMNPLFPGKSEVDQLNRIFKDLGTPSESIWPGYNQLPAVQKMTFAEHSSGGLRSRVGADLLSETGLTLLQGFLTYDPVKRVTAETALDHAYFTEHPVAIDPAMFPTWPAKSEGNRRTTHSPRPPAGGAAYAQKARADSDEALGFRVQPSRSINVAPGFSLKF